MSGGLAALAIDSGLVPLLLEEVQCYSIQLIVPQKNPPMAMSSAQRFLMYIIKILISILYFRIKFF
jgi:hypothetical protein